MKFLNSRTCREFPATMFWRFRLENGMLCFDREVKAEEDGNFVVDEL